MKNTLWFKFIAIALCAAALLAVVGSGCLLIYMSEDDVDADYLEDSIQYELNLNARRIAEYWANQEYGEMPESVAETVLDHYYTWLDWNKVDVEILSETGSTLYSRSASDITDGETDVQETLVQIASLRYQEYVSDDDDEEEDDSKVIVYESLYGEDGYINLTYAYREATLDTPITVKLRVYEGGLQPDDGTVLLGTLGQYRGWIIAVLVLGTAVFAVLTVVLCSCAGSKRGREEIRAGGLCALPLDLYAAGVCLLVFCLAVVYMEIGIPLSNSSLSMTIGLLLFVGYLGCAAVVCFCFAFAAQVRMGHGYWFTHSVTGFVLRLAWRIGKALWQSLPRAWRLAVRVVKDACKVALALLNLVWSWTKRVVGLVYRGAKKLLWLCERTLSLLPLTWQCVVIGAVLVLWLVFAVASSSSGAVIVWLIAALAAVLYGANCFGILFSGAKRMRGGDLETKIESKYLVGEFREFSEELNGLADVAMVAAQKQLKSERMKTELITNVSHDIKTPLTSIINYVDLLGRPHTPEDEAAYLEVLSRQSQRLKKLIDDLIEMSKASTGNIQAEITRIDAAEAVNQALGEFSDKLTLAGLTPVFHQSKERVYLMADGRLLWRAMSNILSNAVKYALPGTRLYVDITAAEAQVLISFKNISGAQLNISADELMERFVRGDVSRNTDGSGLGLNIAKSLMELQGGQLELLVDGDLFKVTLVFRKAEPAQEETE